MHAKTIETSIFCALLGLTVLACQTEDPPVARLKVEPTEVRLPFPGVADIELSWETERPLSGVEGTPLVFVHLVDDQGEVLRTFDHPLEFEWQPGRTEDYVVHLYQSALAPPLEPGVYGLTIGLYDASGRRWPLSVDGEVSGRNEYRVAEVEVGSDSEGAPMFFFSPAWLPLESGMDAQVVARRWLGGSQGAIRVSDCPHSGSIWMRIRIPGTDSGGTRLILDDEASAPEVRVTSTCGLEEICVSGSGFHEIEVSLAAAQKELLEECELRLEPNFHLDEGSVASERSLALEVLAWAD
jgi:hypothetical protein